MAIFFLLTQRAGVKGRPLAVGCHPDLSRAKSAPRHRRGRVKVEVRWLWFNVTYKEMGMNPSNKQHGGS